MYVCVCVYVCVCMCVCACVCVCMFVCYVLSLTLSTFSLLFFFSMTFSPQLTIYQVSYSSIVYLLLMITVNESLGVASLSFHFINVGNYTDGDKSVNDYNDVGGQVSVW